MVINVDGARVLFDEGWGLVRASNTQPVLVLRFEAKDENGLEKIPLNPPLQKGEAKGMPGLIEGFRSDTIWSPLRGLSGLLAQ